MNFLWTFWTIPYLIAAWMGWYLYEWEWGVHHGSTIVMLSWFLVQMYVQNSSRHVPSESDPPWNLGHCSFPWYLQILKPESLISEGSQGKNKGWDHNLTMFFSTSRIAQTPYRPTPSILNEKTCSHEIVYYTAVDGNLVRLCHPLMKATHNL